MERKGNLPGKLVSTTEEKEEIEKKGTSPPVIYWRLNLKGTVPQYFDYRFSFMNHIYPGP
jgi:hypothetical protein